MKQSRTMSFVETVANVASGALVSWLLTMWVLPLWGYAYTATQAWQITATYTAASIVRAYAWRRWFATRDH